MCRALPPTPAWSKAIQEHGHVWIEKHWLDENGNPNGKCPPDVRADIEMFNAWSEKHPWQGRKPMTKEDAEALKARMKAARERREAEKFQSQA